VKAKRDQLPWAGTVCRAAASWRKELHRDFERALTETKPPERPDYEAANSFLVKVRRGIANK
jgi:hypothetical protein